MVTIADITDARKEQLALLYGGEDGCINDDSLMTAIYNDLSSEFRIYSGDFMFLLDKNYCVEQTVTPVETVKQGLLVKASVDDVNVFVNGTWRGTSGTALH